MSECECTPTHYGGQGAPSFCSGRFEFVWLSDTHIELPRWNPGEPEATIDYLSNMDLAFVVVTGDLVNDCLDVANFTEYKTTVVDEFMCSVNNIPGNHDGASGDHTNYISVLGPIHFPSFTAGPVRVIGIVPSECVDLHATMPQSELDYLEAELQAAGEAVPLVFSHYPVLPDFHPGRNITTGGDELLALLRDYEVKAYFSGHIHSVPTMILQAGTAHVDGGAFVPPVADATNSYLMICHIYADHITISHRRGVSPWDERDLMRISLT